MTEAAPPTLPPGPRGIEAFRTLLSFSALPNTRFGELRDRWGDVFSIPAAGEVVVLLSDPVLIGEVLLDKQGVFHKDVITHSLTSFLGQGLLTSEDALWKKQRKLIAPSLTRKQVASYADVMVERTLAYVNARANDGNTSTERDVYPDITELTLDIVVDTLFGTELPADAQLGEQLHIVMDAFKELVQTWRRVFPQWFPFPARTRVRRASRALDVIVRDVIAKKRSQQQAEGQAGDDLLSRLLAARGEDGSAMSDTQLRDEAVTMILAGHETTANALCFSLYLLAKNPLIAAKLRAEHAAVVGTRKPTFDDLSKLVYADATFRETMRLYPPAYMIGRKPTKDIVLGGHRIPKNAQILISPWTLHRDPRWFEQAEVFRPERWLEGQAERLPKNAYLPFGGGPRVCVGNHFAMMEGTLMLSILGAQLAFEPIAEAELDLMTAITLRPRHELRLGVRPVGVAPHELVTAALQ